MLKIKLIVPCLVAALLMCSSAFGMKPNINRTVAKRPRAFSLSIALSMAPPVIAGKRVTTHLTNARNRLHNISLRRARTALLLLHLETAGPDKPLPKPVVNLLTALVRSMKPVSTDSQ